MKDLTVAREILLSEDYTCALCRDGDVRTFTLRGVKPIVALIERGESFDGYCAADKVVGRATAFLYAIIGVRAVYARVISRAALSVLKDSNTYVEYEDLVDNIINRAGDGICPFEAAVLNINDASEAYSAILAKMREMNIKVEN